jgi:hypothetical protein
VLGRDEKPELFGWIIREESLEGVMLKNLMVAVVLVVLFSGSALAQELHGFLQLEGASSSPSPKLSRAWVNLTLHPASDIATFIQVDVVSGELLDAEVSKAINLALSATITVRAGNLLTPAGMGIPSPQDEQLIGGPAVGQLVNFYAQGVEVAAAWRGTQARIGLIRGGRLPEVMGAISVSGEIVRAAIAFQAGGDRTVLSAVAYAGDTVFAEAHAAAELLPQGATWAASLIGGYDLGQVVLTAQLDEVHTTMIDHQFRFQVTKKVGVVSLAVQEAWSSVSGFLTTVRLQGNF